VKKNSPDAGNAEEAFTYPMQKTVIAEALEQGMQPEAIIENSTIAAFVSAGATLAGLAVTGPIGGLAIAAVAIIGTLMPVFYADDTWAPLTDKIIALVTPLIDQAILKNTLNKANAARKRNYELCENIADAFKKWEETGERREALIAYYHTLTLTYLPDLTRDFLQEDLRSVLLPQYVNSALIYLPILSAYYTHADKLQLPTRELTSPKQMVLDQFRSDVENLTDVAVTSYQQGLRAILERSDNSKGTWDEYNEYRNKMTISALDFVARFAYFDPVNYATRVAEKYFNRKLLNFFDTHDDSKSAQIFRQNIRLIEDKFNKPTSVNLLKKINFYSGNFLAHTEYDYSHHVIDGLNRAQCLLTSVDGNEEETLLEMTGEQEHADFARDITHRIIEIQPNSLFLCNGYYWNDASYTEWGNTRYPYARTIVNIKGHFKSPENKYNNFEIYFNKINATPTQMVSPFFMGIPDISGGSVTVTPTDFSEQITDFSVIFEPRVAHHSYLFGYRHQSISNDLLPRKNHVSAQNANPIEQFHAIKAATSIKKNKLTIIPGPGFTGGDLVKINGGTDIVFTLNNNKGRWFAGNYKVRIWFIKPNTSPFISVTIFPTGNSISFEVSAKIPAKKANETIDPNQLKFNDLASYTYASYVMITPEMSAVKLVLANTTPGGEIIVDRIELIHV